MATFFGEVVDRQSRAFWDGEEDFEDISDTDLKCEFKVHYTGKVISHPNIELFVVVHGPLTIGFASTCLFDDTQLIAEINEVMVPDDDIIKKRQPKPSKLYHLKGSVIVCMCSPDLDMKHAHPFTDVLSAWLNVSQKVIVLTCSFATSYTSEDDNLPISFLRELHTDNYTIKTLCDPLEQPNLIAGIPAAFLSRCQVFNIPAILYVVYTDCNVADSISAAPLVQLFSQMPIKLLKSEKPFFKKRLYDGPEVGSNLYM